MTLIRPGMIAVIFTSTRNGQDGAAYAEAADAMERLARQQPGFVAVESVRGEDGFGITVSYWADKPSAAAWRDHPEHSGIRETGRNRWYDNFQVVVSRVERSYSKVS